MCVRSWELLWHAGFICLQPTTLPNPTQNHPNKVNVMNVLWWSPSPLQNTPGGLKEQNYVMGTWCHNKVAPASQLVCAAAPEWPLLTGETGQVLSTTSGVELYGGLCGSCEIGLAKIEDDRRRDVGSAIWFWWTLRADLLGCAFWGDFIGAYLYA